MQSKKDAVLLYKRLILGTDDHFLMTSILTYKYKQKTRTDQWFSGVFTKRNGDICHSVVSRTLMRCLLTHLVKVFFCTLSRSSKEHREKREVNDMFELHTPPQRLELYYLCQLVRKKKTS